MKLNRSFLLKNMFFFIGIFSIGLGVAFMNKSNLGLGPWNVTDANLERWIGVTLGQASQIHTFSIITLVVILNKNPKYYWSVITTFLVGLAIDLWNYQIIGTWVPQNLLEQTLFELIGFLGICIGLALILVTRYPAMVFDELTITLNKLFPKMTFPMIRIFIEFSGLGLALIYGLLGGFGLGALSLGPIFLAFCFGPAIHFFKVQLERMTSSWGFF